MKTWMLVQVAAVALAVALFTAPTTRTAAEATATVTVATSVRAHAPLIVRVAVADTSDVMTDACVFSAEAMAAGAPAQCGAPKLVPAMIRFGEGPDGKALVWPGDFFEITANAAVDAWDATIDFVGDLFGLAKENGLDI